MTDPNKSQRKSFGPESDFWNKLKGQTVRVRTTMQGTGETEVVYCGKLLWVDRYTIGVLVTPYLPISGKPLESKEVMLFKSVLATVEAA